MIKEYFNFIYERQLIWQKKEVLGLEAPWTSDKVLATYKFCCSYRELDKGTKYLINSVINKPWVIEQKIFNIIYYRRFNWPGFFEFSIPRHGCGFKMKDHEEEFDKAILMGIKLFNNAYTICQVPFDASYRPKDKHIQILMSMESIGKQIMQLTESLENSKSLKECHNILTSIKLIGPFLAYQILQDINYIPNFLQHEINSFVHVGPGAAPAIEMLNDDFKVLGLIKTNEQACKFLFDSQEFYFNVLKSETKKDWKKIYYPNAYYNSPYLSIGNIQSCLCEFRKWKNLSNGKGRKRYYNQGEKLWKPKNGASEIALKKA